MEGQDDLIDWNLWGQAPGRTLCEQVATYSGLTAIQARAIIEVTAGEGAEIAEGDYPNADISFGIAHDSDEGLVTDAGFIPIHLVVG